MKISENMKKNEGYSIAEALVTMLIIMLVFLVAVPSMISKRHKRAAFIIGHDQHGYIECVDKDECEITLPKGESRDLFVMAVGGGGGGSGSYCGDDMQRYNGKKDKEVKGQFSFNNDRVLYLEASAASGGSSQGFCDPYPGKYVKTTHETKCNLYPKATWTREFYKEVRKVEEVYGCEWEDTDECTDWKVIAGSEVCKAYKQEYICRFRPTDPPVYYWDLVVDSGRTQFKKMSCNLNPGKVTSLCNRNSYDNSDKYTYYPNYGHGLSQRTTINLGRSQEQIDTKREDVCSVSWEYSPTQSASNRYCNGSLFGGKGGSGQYYSARICPMGIPTACLQWREGHKIASFCTKEQLQKEAAESGQCPLGMLENIPKYGNILDKILKDLMESYYAKCGPEALRVSLKNKKICGHDKGEYNCVVEHGGEMKRTCNRWRIGKLASKFLLGKPGLAGPAIYTSPGFKGDNSMLFIKEEIDYGGGVSSEEPGIYNMQNNLKLTGGDAGRFSKNGAERGGVPGGEHTGYIAGYNHYDYKKNTKDGNIAYIQAVEKWVQAGLGGGAGQLRSGYLKNVSGKVTIKIGEGGEGGEGMNFSAPNGKDIVVVDMVNNVIKDISGKVLAAADKLESLVSDKGGTKGGDTVVQADGQTIVALGGGGGGHTKIYETCSSSEGVYFDKDMGQEVLEYPGRFGEKSETGLGNGGDGTGDIPGRYCKGTKGKNGQKGGAIVFY